MMGEALRDEGDIWAGYRKDRAAWFPQDLLDKHGPRHRSKNVYFAGCTASYVEKDIGMASVLPMMMPDLMPTMLARVKAMIPMPDYMAEQMPELMPKVMDNLMPHMINDVVPLVTQPMIDYLKTR